MHSLVAQLGELGSTGGIVLMAVGLACGLLGWRLIRHLAVANAVAGGVMLGVYLQAHGGQEWLMEIPVSLPAGAFAIACGCLAHRFPKCAVAATVGATGFLVAQVPLMEHDWPRSVLLLVGLLGGGLALAMQATLPRHTAVVVTGLEGGWLCAGAIVAGSSDPQSFGALLIGAIYVHSFLFPLMALVFSMMLTALQLTDMEQNAGACANT